MRNRPKARLTLTPLHCTAAALALLLAGCAGESSVPFLPSAQPGPTAPLELPLLVPPPRDKELTKPVLTPEEQKALEEQLEKLQTTRERAVRRGIEKGN